jgi:hypothetical protein
LVAASQKTWFWHSEYEKALFMGRNENRPSWRSSPSQGTRFVSNMAPFRQTMPW